MRVVVDPDRCQGHARCWDVCPEVFSLDDQGHAVVASGEVAPGLVGKVEEAVGLCPERAIVFS